MKRFLETESYSINSALEYTAIEQAPEMSFLFSSPEQSESDVQEESQEDFLSEEDCSSSAEMTSNELVTSDPQETVKMITDAYDVAKTWFDKSELVKALEITEKMISNHGMNKACSLLHHLQGDVFLELARITDTSDVKCIYLFASVDAYSTSTLLCCDDVESVIGCVRSLIELGDQLGNRKFYEKALSRAKRGFEKHQETSQDSEKEQLHKLLNLAAEKMTSNAASTVAGTTDAVLTVAGTSDAALPVSGTSNAALTVARTSDAALTVARTSNAAQTVLDTSNAALTVAGTTDAVLTVAGASDVALTVSGTGIAANQMGSVKRDHLADKLKTFWAKLDDKTKRDFLVVDSKKLIEFIKDKYGKKGRACFRKSIAVLEENQWGWWKCYVCAQVCYCFTDYKRHIFDNHVNKFVPQLSSRPKCGDKTLTDMICRGDWKPVDIAETAKFIKDQNEAGKEFAYDNGWCSEWSVAKDEDRESTLNQLAQDLKSSCKCGYLSRDLWDLLIDYTEENVQLPQVTGRDLDKCSFFSNPQCICFLDMKHLESVLKLFRELTEDVCTSLLSKVVTQLSKKSVVKERIDLHRETFDMLLDERLLYEGRHQFDETETETVRTLESCEIYDHVKPDGDEIVSWILDCPKIDEKVMSQMAKGVNNLEIWIAALRMVRRTARKERIYYEKRKNMVTYDKILCEVETLCEKEDNRRNVNYRSRYALMLQMECEERVKQAEATKCFFNVVRDVLEGAESPRFDVLEDNMECISGLSTSLENVAFKGRLMKLRNSLKKELRLINSKIFLKEHIYSVLQNFPKISTVDSRLVVLPLIKKFLRGKLKEMIKKQKRQASDTAGASVTKKLRR